MSPLAHPPLPIPTSTAYVRELVPTDIENRQFSTLDLCSPRYFTFFVRDRSVHWFIKEVSFSLAGTIGHTFMPFRTITLDADIDLAAFEQTEEGKNWLQLAKLEGPGGFVLVRPDQHILIIGNVYEVDPRKLVQDLAGYLELS